MHDGTAVHPIGTQSGHRHEVARRGGGEAVMPADNMANAGLEEGGAPSTTYIIGGRDARQGAPLRVEGFRMRRMMARASCIHAHGTKFITFPSAKRKFFRAGISIFRARRAADADFRK